jgi:hypothetical protein
MFRAALATATPGGHEVHFLFRLADSLEYPKRAENEHDEVNDDGEAQRTATELGPKARFAFLDGQRLNGQRQGGRI